MVSVIGLMAMDVLGQTQPTVVVVARERRERSGVVHP
jgi:hypothetical protein